MFSVTKRIDHILQPRGGYIDPSLFKTTHFDDGKHMYDIPSNYKHIQGLAVDYLTRFMSGCLKENAFRISLWGSDRVSERDNAERLLNSINGLDEKSVYSACQLVGYDIAFRRGPQYFSPVNLIDPGEETIHNIIVMVERSLDFLEKYGPIVKEGFTFEGGYTEVVTSGDGDYLSYDTLWDFKVSQDVPTSKHTLQLLMYYILGIHSIYDEFQYIKKIGIFNPQQNTAYELELAKITDRVYCDVSREVLGYNVPADPAQWRLASGTDKCILEDALYLRYKDAYLDTGFNPDSFSDGIYDITVDDYWSYYRRISEKDRHRPMFLYTQSIKFLKNKGFIMFISVTKNGSMCILQGGAKRRLYEALEYYYIRLPEYGQLILDKFSQYWDALYSVSNQLLSIGPDKDMQSKQYEEYMHNCKTAEIACLDFDSWHKCYNNPKRFSGRIHGCIVDLDYFNHLYLNPYDGKLIPYYAPSIYEKYTYKNVASLIADKMPDMLPSFQRAIGDHGYSLIASNATSPHALAKLSETEISMYNAVVTDTKMYDVSSRMKGLQTIYDHHLVEVWYDHILLRYEIENKNPHMESSLVGQSKIMKSGELATVIEDYSPFNISVQFEDGHIVKYCHRDDFYSGKIKNKPKK